jgi:hypothetical protein
VIDRDELRAKAEAATPGPWLAKDYMYSGRVEDRVRVTSPSDSDEFNLAEGVLREDAEYIAAVSPDVVLALLDERAASPSDEEREALIDTLQDSSNWWHNGIHTVFSPSRGADAILAAGWSRSVSRPRSDAEIEAAAEAYDAASIPPVFSSRIAMRAALAAADAVRQEGSK